MPYKNAAVVVCLQVWNTSSGVGQTGDASNLTLRGVGDGTEYTPGSPTITEMDSTNLKGIYKVSLTAAENNYSVNMLGGISSTANVVVTPAQWTNEINANVRLRKNVACSNFAWLMVSSTDHVTPKTGATVACQRSIDGAAFANCNTATATELANGVYTVNLAASDLNGDIIVLKFTATGADQRTIVIVTEP